MASAFVGWSGPGSVRAMRSSVDLAQVRGQDVQLGAVFRDGGYGAALAVVERYFAADLGEKKLGQRDFKTRLQEISQMLFREPPVYRIVAEKGPDHAKRFVTEIFVGGKMLGRGEGPSKKQSEQEAAKKALGELQESQLGDGES